MNRKFFNISTVGFLVFFLFVFSNTVFAYSPRNSSLSCKVRSYMVDDSYSLPYKFDTYELIQGARINPGNKVVHVFDFTNNTGKIVTIKNILVQNIENNLEPIMIEGAQIQNGTCTYSQPDKVVQCASNYSAGLGTTSGPFQLLYKTTDNPNNYPKIENSIFVDTDQGSTSCGGLLFLNGSTAKHPVSWETPFASFKASDFLVKANDVRFVGLGPITYIHSDPGSKNYTTLEVEWQENGVGMRLNLYFARDDSGQWKITEIRTYNGLPRGDWLYYYADTKGELIASQTGQHNYKESRTFISTDGKGELTCTGCDFNAFMSYVGSQTTPPPTETKTYYMSVLTGLPVGTINLVNNSSSAFGATIRMFDGKNYEINDSDFAYEWEVSPPKALSLQFTSLNKKSVKVVPAMDGKATLTASAFKNGVRVASSSISVNVVPESKDEAELRENRDRRIAELQNQVSELTNKVNKQQSLLDQINAKLNQIIENLSLFIGHLFK